MPRAYPCPDCDRSLTGQGLWPHGSSQHGWSRERYQAVRAELGLPVPGDPRTSTPPPAAPDPAPAPATTAEETQPDPPSEDESGAGLWWWLAGAAVVGLALLTGRRPR